MQEIWKDIIDYENKYQISNLGNVRRIKKDGSTRMLKATVWGRYLTVDLHSTENGIGKDNRQYIHRLVAMHFIPNPRNVNFVNHIDGNELNNVYTNLEWVTNSENLIHASRALGRHPFGQQPKAVNQYTLDDVFIKRFNSIGEAVEEMKKINDKANRSHISECCRNIIVSAYGYKWQYADN